jgi:hypothetical protein
MIQRHKSSVDGPFAAARAFAGSPSVSYPFKTRLLKYSHARFETSSPDTCGAITANSSGVK